LHHIRFLHWVLDHYIYYFFFISGKRHLIERSPFSMSKLKYPKKSITTVTSSSQIGGDFHETKRRSKRNLKRIPSYCYSSSGSEWDENEGSYRQSPSMLDIKPAPFKTKLRRKVSSNYQDNRLGSAKRNNLRLENANDISFFSGSNAVLQSSTKQKAVCSRVEKVYKKYNY